MSEEDAGEADAEHFKDVVHSFVSYQRHSMARVHRARHDFATLSEALAAHQAMAPFFLKKVEAMERAIAANQAFIGLFAVPERLFENQEMPSELADFGSAALPSEDNMHKARSTLRQFEREWGAGGAEERAACFQPIIRLVQERYPLDASDPADINKYRVLVPGCGLARLVWEFAHRGYACQGNEFAYHCLIASNFVLNQCRADHPHTLYPYVLQSSNRFDFSHQFRETSIPDVNPSDLPNGVDFSMNAGEFVLIYSEAEHESQWDVVAAPFFLDTAHNPIVYMETIWHMLRPGGSWFNLGPLLYHYTDSAGEISIEMSLVEVIHAARQIGFQVEARPPVQCTYSGDIKSMQATLYNCAFFVAKKPAAVTSQ